MLSDAGLQPGAGSLADVVGQWQSFFGRTLDSAVGRAVRGLGAADPASAATGRAGAEPEAFHLAPAAEARLLASVDDFLARGRDLKRWWDEAGRRGFAERFGLGRTFNEPSASFGFFDHAAMTSPALPSSLPVMGNFQEMFYDRPKLRRDGPGETALWMRRQMRDQMREFALRYFMRVSDFREPEGYVDRSAAAGAPGPLSWCPREEAARKGFGFQQLYYKLRATGEVGAFAPEERFAIVDLRELGATYEWIVVKVCIFDFSFSFRPFGPGTPQLALPLQEDSFLVLSRDFITDAEAPAPGLAGRYGLGYAFLKNPEPGFLAYGPGEFDAAIELIDFEVHDGGEVRVAMTFVANRPERLVNFAVDPVRWGFGLADLMSLGMASRLFAPLYGALGGLPLPRLEIDPVFAFVDLANLLSGGAAASQLCISRRELDREFLVKHFVQHYTTLAGSLATWRRVPDWLDEAALPDWVRRGKSF